MCPKNSTQAPTPTLLPPPGPAILSIRVLPSGITTDPAEHRPRPRLFYDAINVRDAVFVVEQKCSAAEEIDADDAVSWHWVIHAERESAEGRDKRRVPAATIRLVPAQAHADAEGEKAVDGPDYAGSMIWDRREPYVKIGRLATLKEFRGRGYGRVLVDTALGFTGRNGASMVLGEGLGEWKGLVLAHAQKGVEGWYNGVGFVSDEGMGRWWEEGVEHLGVWRRVEIVG